MSHEPRVTITRRCPICDHDTEWSGIEQYGGATLYEAPCGRCDMVLRNGWSWIEHRRTETT